MFYFLLSKYQFCWKPCSYCISCTCIVKIKELKSEIADLKNVNTNLASQIPVVDLNDSSVSEITAVPHKQSKQSHQPCTSTQIGHLPPIPLDSFAELPHASPTPPPHMDMSLMLNSTDDVDNSFTTKPKIKIIGTSMTRNFAEHLLPLFPEFDVSGDTYPNGKISVIFNQLISIGARFGPNDYILICAGSNDIPHLYPQDMDKYLESCNHIFNHTNVIFCGIPYMYHRNNVNTNIFAINQYIQFQCTKFKIYFLDTNSFMSRSMFTKHGLHFTLKGKIFICEIIEKLILILESSMSSFFPYKYSHPFCM